MNSHYINIIYDLNEKPFGKTWAEWTAECWKWLLEIPKDVNPGYDDSSEKILNQQDPNVVFLIGTYGGSAVRHYRIPIGKAILFPVVAFTTSFAEEPQLRTESDLISRAKKDIDDISRMQAIIDGEIINDLSRYRVMSPIFEFTFPEDNVVGAKAGASKGISDGYWIFLKPLNPGKHTVYASGSCSSGKTTVDVLWHLTVS
jgi:hypothetical protein